MKDINPVLKYTVPVLTALNISTILMLVGKFITMDHPWIQIQAIINVVYVVNVLVVLVELGIYFFITLFNDTTVLKPIKPVEIFESREPVKPLETFELLELLKPHEMTELLQPNPQLELLELTELSELLELTDLNDLPDLNDLLER